MICVSSVLFPEVIALARFLCACVSSLEKDLPILSVPFYNKQFEPLYKILTVDKTYFTWLSLSFLKGEGVRERLRLLRPEPARLGKEIK